jgi:cytochrome c oxidase subunit 2
MQLLLIFLAIVLVFVVIIQVAKATELISVLKTEDEYREDTSRSNSVWLVITGIFLLVFIVVTAVTSVDKFLPPSASEHGNWIQSMINVTLFFTGVVFLITHILLFYFTWKYRYKRSGKAYYYPDNNKLELAWTVVPAIVLTVLVAMGIDKWFKIFADAPEEAIKIEATAKQFGWYIRYPGGDNKLGPRDFTLTNQENELGVNWKNDASQDDFLSDEIVLPVNLPVSVNIAALDVIHNFYLPEFRLMMDAVPGITTKFWFKPTITTAQMREIKNDPEFDYELACNQLCGSGHWNMKKKVTILSEEEYRAWAAQQKPYLEQNPPKSTEQPSSDSTTVTAQLQINN